MTAYTAGTEGEDATVAGRDFSQLEDLVVSMLTLGEAAAFFRNTAPHHVHGDCLKLAPCTLPKSKEAW